MSNMSASYSLWWRGISRKRATFPRNTWLLFNLCKQRLSKQCLLILVAPCNTIIILKTSVTSYCNWSCCQQDEHINPKTPGMLYKWQWGMEKKKIHANCSNWLKKRAGPKKRSLSLDPHQRLWFSQDPCNYFRIRMIISLAARFSQAHPTFPLILPSYQY